jgi:hypothetical protein
VAENVTLVPEQIAPDGTAAMLTPATPAGLTVITTAFDVAGLPVTQAAVDVITQVMLFPFANPASVYVALLVPTLTPSFFH